MNEILTESQFNSIIADHNAALLYFSTPDCNVCKVLKPKLEEAIRRNFPLLEMGYVNIENIPNVASQNRIFTVPTIVVYFEGKELIRKSRNVSVEEYIKELERPYKLFFE